MHSFIKGMESFLKELRIENAKDIPEAEEKRRTFISNTAKSHGNDVFHVLRMWNFVFLEFFFIVILLSCRRR